MVLSIIIVTWNSVEVLRKCLPSLNFAIKSDDIEIILVDNGSLDNVTSFVEQNYPKIKTLELPENKGVAYARNRGIEYCIGKYLLLLDDDTIVNAEAINGMLEFMINNSDVGICGCKLVDDDGNIQDSYKSYPGIDVKIMNIIRKKKKPLDFIEYRKIIEPEYIVGACQMIRRDLIDDIGLLDEKIFYGPEDADFCLRARNSGWKVCYLSEYIIVHKWRRITNEKIFSFLAYKHAIALIYFYWKYKRLF